MLVDGRTVPGLSVTPIRGESGPTMLEGEPVRHDDEVVLGVDTADRLGVGVGDKVQVQSGTAYPVGPPPPPMSLRVVGLATFAAISQQGSDEARLGVGALVTRPTFESAARLRREPARVDHGQPGGGHRPDGAHRHQPRRRRGRARGQDAVVHRSRDPPSSCSSTRPRPCSPVPSRSRSCSSSRVLAQGAWSRTRASAAELSVLQALGCSRHQLARIAAWQTVPPGLAALAIGVPLGIAVGRLAFSAFARSIAWWTHPSSPPWLVVALALAVVASVGAGALVAGQVGAPASQAPPPSATPKAAAPDLATRERARGGQSRSLERPGPAGASRLGSKRVDELVDHRHAARPGSARPRLAASRLRTCSRHRSPRRRGRPA